MTQQVKAEGDKRTRRYVKIRRRTNCFQVCLEVGNQSFQIGHDHDYSDADAYETAMFHRRMLIHALSVIVDEQKP